MTLNQFMEKLEQTPREWHLTVAGCVRYADSEHCPLSFVANTEPCSIYVAADRLGIVFSTVNRIADAADGVLFTEDDRAMRARLLKACGLL